MKRHRTKNDAQLERIRKRIAAGFYDQPEVIETIAANIAAWMKKEGYFNHRNEKNTRF